MAEGQKDVDAANLELSAIASEGEQDWAARVLGWAEDRNLIQGSTPERQLVKLREEMWELTEAIDSCDSAAAKDAIGDCAVVLRIMANQLSFHWDDCLEHAWDQIMDRTGRMVDGLFVKDAR